MRHSLRESFFPRDFVVTKHSRHYENNCQWACFRDILSQRKGHGVGNSEIGGCKEVRQPFPEGPARHLDVSRQKLTPHCLATIFDSQLPSPTLSLKMPPKMSPAHKRGFFFSFKIAPTVRVTARQLRDKNCLTAIFAPRHLGVSFGPLGLPTLRQPLANPLPTLRQPFANPLPTFSANPSPTPSFRGSRHPCRDKG